MNKWKIIKSELVFDNKWFKVQKDVVELPNGKIMDDYFMWKNNNVSLVVAFTSENKIVLEKQYKHALDDFMIEVPAGVSEDNENSYETAKRELLEETGYTCEKMELLGELCNNPTKEMGETVVFFAKDVKKTSEPSREDDESEMEVFEVSIDEALSMIYDGRIKTTGTIAAIFLALKNINYKI